MKQEEKKANMAIIAIFVLGIIAVLLCTTGCKQQQFGSHQQDSVRIVQRIDTFMVYSRDSVIMQMPCSDSIEVAYVDRWHTNTIINRTIAHDTISTCRIDTIIKPVDVVHEVVRNSRFAYFCEGSFFAMVAFILVFLGFSIYRKFFL